MLDKSCRCCSLLMCIVSAVVGLVRCVRSRREPLKATHTHGRACLHSTKDDMTTWQRQTNILILEKKMQNEQLRKRERENVREKKRKSKSKTD